MKKALLIAFLAYVSSYAIAQEYICLKDGSVSRDKPTTLSERTIENTDKGILATYKFNFATRHTDTFFLSASVLLLEGCNIAESYEKPVLPHKLDRFAIPGDEPYRIVIIDSSYIELPMEIAPSRPPMIDSSNGLYSKENVRPVKPYTGYYPENVITSVLNPYRSNSILDVHINPIQYDYHSKKVRIYNSLSYLIEFNKATGIDAAIKGSSPETDLLLSNIVMNPRENADRILDGTPRNSSVQLATPGYLIITVPEYLEAVNKFADWKRTLGFNVRIISSSLWEDSIVMDSISSLNPIPEYLLIVGNDDDVPGIAVTDTIYSLDGTGYFGDYVTDYYYGCVNQNNYPDIRRGRLPVSSATRAKNVIDKIIQYEREPITDTLFYKTGLNCAYFQDDNKDGYEDFRFTLTSEDLRDYLVNEIGKTVNRIYYANNNPRYWNCGQYGFPYSVPLPSDLLSNDFTWNGNSTDIQASINAGAFYVFHRGHGSSLCWENPFFSYQHINNGLNNGKKLPVVFSMNCLTGRYNENPCFAESFLRKKNGGCVAIFAATENSFSGFNDALAIGMFDAIWPGNGYFKKFPYQNAISLSSSPTYRLGDILDIGLSEIQTIYSFCNDSVLRHTKEIFHCFGDPAMEIYTDTPTPFAHVSISKHNNFIDLSLQDSAKITFFNTLTGVIESYYGTSVSYPFSSNLRICVSKHNKIPLIIEQGNLYMQNEEIATSVDYEAETIKVGSNVTLLKSPGDVIIRSGTTKLKGETVELREGTTVEIGSQLEITN